MKYAVCIIVVLIAGCSDTQPDFKSVAVQHIGKGIMNGDACKTLYREDGKAVVSPINFKITPFDAIEIAKEELGYSCNNKLGAQILAHGKFYYIVRLSDTEGAIIINGENGSIVSKGFMAKSN